ncbi:hypothetical protein DKM44_13250 [Deinococcus irradiatisoli]|uniref:Uncharacterized protein n=1 Tax=Deinococcus irradiatisoli TaxID=2202254 RepID=A0A2Z3JNP7_9DEIO|nr:hypothetical protein [Deinococcus irradiatisoli]AWN24680.1 hypothetical protein DKM44_13250 [Deinococcus irradiatisoli]
MPYLKLSEQVGKLANPQRSDTFVKRFRDAVREGQFDAITVPDRFELPKKFAVRNSDETRTKSMREMIFEASPEFDAWFDEINRGLAASRTGGKIKPTAENIEAGLVDFKAMAEETRRKMQASHDKGQKLGSSRAGQRAAPKAAKKTSKAK